MAVFHPGVGSPLACGLFEQVISTGCRKFVACGGAGALVPGLALGHVVVPDGAVRDEGAVRTHGRVPACEAVLTSGARGVQVELRLPQGLWVSGGVDRNHQQ